MEKLAAKNRFITEAAKAVNPFAKFPGPDGTYYAKLSKIVWSEDKDQNFVCRMAFITIANVEDGSVEFGACPVRIQFYLRDGKNSSEKDAWERMYTQGYQALGCVTAGWESLRDTKNQLIPVLETLNTETIRLNDEKPCVTLSITQNPKDVRYQNINIRDILAPGALDAFTIPSMQLDDDALNTDELADEIEESTLPDFTPSVEAAKAMLAPLDTAGIIEQAQASQLDLDYNQLASQSPEQCRTAVLVAYIENAGYVASDYDLSFDSPSGTTEPSNEGFAGLDEQGDVTVPDSIEDNSSLMEEALEEELEEPIVEVDEPPPSFADRCSAYIESLTDRTAIKKAVIVLKPDAKFYAKQTDDDIRNELSILITATNGGFQFPPF